MSNDGPDRLRPPSRKSDFPALDLHKARQTGRSTPSSPSCTTPPPIRRNFGCQNLRRLFDLDGELPPGSRAAQLRDIVIKYDRQPEGDRRPRPEDQHSLVIEEPYASAVRAAAREGVRAPTDTELRGLVNKYSGTVDGTPGRRRSPKPGGNL